MHYSQVAADKVFHALSDATRRAIIKQLCRGPITVSRLAKPLDITLTAVGQHLQVLQDSGLVRTTKLGRERTCNIEKTGFVILQHWIDHHRSMWEARLDRLGELLAEPAMDAKG